MIRSEYETYDANYTLSVGCLCLHSHCLWSSVLFLCVFLLLFVCFWGGPQCFYSPWLLCIFFLFWGQNQSHWILLDLYIWENYMLWTISKAEMGRLIYFIRYVLLFLWKEIMSVFPNSKYDFKTKHWQGIQILNATFREFWTRNIFVDIEWILLIETNRMVLF